VTLNVEQVFFNLLLAALFSVLGFALLFAGYRVLDALTPEHMSRKIFEEGNVAVAVLAAGFVIGLALIIAASVGG
jgi:putative membrane protein